MKPRENTLQKSRFEVFKNPWLKTLKPDAFKVLEKIILTNTIFKQFKSFKAFEVLESTFQKSTFNALKALKKIFSKNLRLNLLQPSRKYFLEKIPFKNPHLKSIRYLRKHSSKMEILFKTMRLKLIKPSGNYSSQNPSLKSSRNHPSKIHVWRLNSLWKNISQKSKPFDPEVPKKKNFF